MWRRWMLGAALLVLLGSAACTDDATRSTSEASKPAPPQDDGLSDVVRVPDVRGEKSHTVAQELAEHGLKADIRPRCDLTAETEDGVEERGEIIAVDRVGEVVPLDTRITVHWLDFRILGSAVGQEVQRAREELEASGYEVEVSGRGSTVLAQSPGPDAAVCPESTVRLQT